MKAGRPKKVFLRRKEEIDFEKVKEAAKNVKKHRHQPPPSERTWKRPEAIYDNPTFDEKIAMYINRAPLKNAVHAIR